MSDPTLYFRAMPTNDLPAPVKGRADVKVAFAIGLLGLPIGKDVEVTLWQVEDQRHQKQDKQVGSIKGTVAAVATDNPTLQQRGWVTIKGNFPALPPVDVSKPKVAIMLADPSKTTLLFEMPIVQWNVDEGEAWGFQARITAPDVKSQVLQTAQVRRAVPTNRASYDWHADNAVQFFNGGHERGANAFEAIGNAIQVAEHFIFIADWSFQAYFRVRRPASNKYDVSGTIGSLLIERAKAKPDMIIAIHAWDHTGFTLPFVGAVGAPDEHSDNGMDRLTELAGGKLPPNVLWRKSSRTGSGNSHHQKFFVCDVPGASNGRKDVRAFFGGLDLTKGRWDGEDHFTDPADPKAAEFKFGIRANLMINAGRNWYDDWYNAEFGDDQSLPREPWHDIYGSIIGPAAWDVVHEFVGRWNNDPSALKGTGHACTVEGGVVYPDHAPNVDKVNKKFVEILDDQKFAQQREPRTATFMQHSGPVWAAQVLRSLPTEHWVISDAQKKQRKLDTVPASLFKSRIDKPAERSIQDAYLLAIGQAERFIYIETQYFISSSDQWGNQLAKKPTHNGVHNSLAKFIVDRIVAKRGNFHAFIVTPMYPEGEPNGAAGCAQRQLEWRTMEYMIGRLEKEIGAGNWKKHLSFYFPAKSNGASGGALKTDGKRKERVLKNNRYMIYVHSKLMIVDDRYVIFGSANLNERSLAGDRDSEICIGMWPGYPDSQNDCVQQLRGFRNKLFQDHLGINADAPETMSAAIVAAAQANYELYRTGTANPDKHLCSIPLVYDATNGLSVGLGSAAPEGGEYLPDWPAPDWFVDHSPKNANLRTYMLSQNPNNEWRWDCPGNWLLLASSAPE